MNESVASVVSRANLGDERAWAELFHAYDARMRRAAAGLGFTSGLAADAAQCTWLLLFRNIERLREPERVEGWLLVTMRRECLRIARSQRRELPRGEWGQTELGCHQGAEEEAIQGHPEPPLPLWQAVRGLPPRQRQLILLLSEDPAPSYREVAHRLGMPTGSIGPLRARALRSLRQSLAGAGIAGPAASAARAGAAAPTTWERAAS